MELDLVTGAIMRYTRHTESVQSRPELSWCVLNTISAVRCTVRVCVGIRPGCARTWAAARAGPGRAGNAPETRRKRRPPRAYRGDLDRDAGGHVQSLAMAMPGTPVCSHHCTAAPACGVGMPPPLLRLLPPNALTPSRQPARSLGIPMQPSSSPGSGIAFKHEMVTIEAGAGRCTDTG